MSRARTGHSDVLLLADSARGDLRALCTITQNSTCFAGSLQSQHSQARRSRSTSVLAYPGGSTGNDYPASHWRRAVLRAGS
jgi:hypothetical protein